MLKKYFFRKTWIQAEKRKANPGTLNKWRNWNGVILNRQDWFDSEEDNTLDEPSTGDIYAYMQNGKVYGGTADTKRKGFIMIHHQVK